MLRNADGGGGGVKFSRKKRYEGVRFNVISVTRGWGSNFQKKALYVTLEWPLETIHVSLYSLFVPEHVQLTPRSMS